MGPLHENGPLQADEPPIMRKDAPPGMFTPRWEELQHMELNVLEGYEVKFLFTGYLRTMGFSLCRRGREL